MKNVRAATKLTAFILSALVLIPVQWVGVKLKRPYSKALPRRFHRLLCAIIGIRVVVRGTPYRDGPCLLASNHNSYLDIPVLGSVTPLSFVAKKEVAGWPFFGTLARLQETVFVDRERRTKAAATANEIHQRIAGGDTLVLFPEGTSSDGNRVLPFKSALMAVAQMAVGGGEDPEPVSVQPVSITYTKLCGIPMGRQFRPYFAWYGDMDLGPHLWEAFGLGPFEVVVEFHEPVTLDAHGNRKKLAAYCEQKSAEGVRRSLEGLVPARPAGESLPGGGRTPEKEEKSGQTVAAE
ncbi:MAG: lysophospholipid acyltransferase family protein [Parvibaculaceae bacterium]